MMSRRHFVLDAGSFTTWGEAAFGDDCRHVQERVAQVAAAVKLGKAGEVLHDQASVSAFTALHGD